MPSTICAPLVISACRECDLPPLRGWSTSWRRFPRLAPWATICRPCGAVGFLFLLHFIQIRQRSFQFTLEMAHAQEALDAGQQLEFVDRLADKIISPALGGLLYITKL